MLIFLSLFSRFFWGGGKQAALGLWGGMALNAPLDPPVNVERRVDVGQPRRDH